MPEPFVCGLVLGAGGSKRLGRPKQLLPYGDGTLLGHVVGTARACCFDQTIVAIGGAADDVRTGVDLGGAQVVVNDAYGEGCSSSIAAALDVVDERAAVLVLMLGDQPGVTAQTVAALLAGRNDAELAVCRYDDGRGHPIAFARSVFGELATLHGDKGVWRLLDRGADAVAEVRVPGPVPRDVDTQADYEAVLAPRMNELADRIPDVETLAQRLAAVDYLVDEGLATSLFLGLRLPAAAAARGRGGRRQDRGRAGAGGRARHAADPPAVLRRHRRGRGAVRVELSAPAAEHPARRGGRGGAARGGPVLGRLPDPPAAAAGARAPGPAAGRAADRRDRPRRRRLRGVPARAPGGGARDDPRARHDRGHAPAGDRADLQPDARPARRRQAPLPVPLDRLPVAGARGGDRPAPGEGRLRDARGAGRRRRLADARQRRPEAAGDRRGDRLARRAGPARDRAARRRGGGAHARLGAQVRGGPGGDPRGRPRSARAAAVADVRRRDDRARPAARHRGLQPPAARRGRPGHARAPGRVRPGARRSCARSRRRRLYWTARGVFVSDRAHVAAFDAVFREVFGTGAAAAEREPPATPREYALGEQPEYAPGGDGEPGEEEAEVPRAVAGDQERLATQPLRRARARRARAAVPADGAARARAAAAAHAPPRARPPGQPDRPAQDVARRACAPAASRSASRTAGAGCSAAGS